MLTAPRAHSSSEASSIKKLLAALICAALLLPTVSVVVPQTATPAAASSNIACSVNGLYNNWMYTAISHNMATNGWDTVRGIKAAAWSEARLWVCNGTNHSPYDGPSYWVSIQPDDTNAYYGHSDAIMQIGVINCDDTEFPFPDAVCSGSTPHLFWAYGGCGGYLPVARDLGQSPSSGITLTITRGSGGSWTLTAGTVTRTLTGTDPATSCWASGTGDNTLAVLSSELLDPGDGAGDTASPIGFIDIRFQYSVGGNWYTPDSVARGGSGVTTQLGCNGISGREHCQITRPDEARVWETAS